MKEIYNNNKIQILISDEDIYRLFVNDGAEVELSIGYYPGKFTPYEMWLLARAFDLMEDKNEV